MISFLFNHVRPDRMFDLYGFRFSQSVTTFSLSKGWCFLPKHIPLITTTELYFYTFSNEMENSCMLSVEKTRKSVDNLRITVQSCTYARLGIHEMSESYTRVSLDALLIKRGVCELHWSIGFRSSNSFRCRDVHNVSWIGSGMFFFAHEMWMYALKSTYDKDCVCL